MGSTKNEDYTLRDNRVAAYAKALSHPARIAIIKLIIKRQACICGSLVEALPLSQSTVSQHLKELKSAGLISGEIDGPRVCYYLNKDEWEKARADMLGLFDLAKESPGIYCCTK